MTSTRTFPHCAAASRLAGAAQARWRRHAGTDGLAEWIAGEIDVEKLLQLNRNQLVGAIAGAVNPLLLAWAIWTVECAWFLGVWIAAGWLLAGLQFRSWYRHRTKPRPRRPPRRLTAKVCVLALVNGGYWAALPVVCIPTVNDFEILVIALVVCGMGVGGTVSLALVPLAAALFFCVTIIPTFAVLFLAHPDAGFAFWLLALNFTLFFAMIVDRMHRGFIRNTATAFENSSLAVRARAADQAKTQFIANMSHELRTPLNAINGFSEAMALQLFGALGSKRYEEYAQSILYSGQHLLRIINAMIDISRIEANQYDIVASEQSADGLLRRSLSLVAHQARAAEIEVRLDCPDLTIRVDATAVTQVMLNLLSNAIKFSRPGGIVTASAEARADGSLILAVADSGVGMTPGEIGIALSRFGKVQNALVSNPGGVGLGLPLSRELMVLHGGRLSIRSTPGSGTTVQARFPPGTAQPLPQIGTC